jgi:hypothetical protein
VLLDQKGLAWIGLYRPDEAEIRVVAARQRRNASRSMGPTRLF